MTAKPLGITTAFESTAAAVGQKFAPALTRVNAYLVKREETPKLDWEWMLAAGVLVGSFLSARASSDRDTRLVPKQWARRFGPKPSRRYAGAFVGGALMMFGARMAKGCTSGHGISGTLQLAASSLVFSSVMATTGVLFARAVFGSRKGAR